MKQKTRDEIQEKDKWDLTFIFKTEDEFDKAYDEAKEEIKEVSNYKGKLLESSDMLFNYLDYSEKVERKLYKLYYYTHLNLDSDTTNTISQAKEGKVENLFQEYSVLSSFVQPEFLKGDMKLIEKFIEEKPELKRFHFDFSQLYRMKDHYLNEEKKEMLSMLSKSFVAEDTFEALTDADMTFPNILVNGEEVELTESNYGTYIEDKNRDLRRDVFTKLLTTYGKYKNTLAKTFSGNIEYHTSMAKITKYSSSIEASLDYDNIPVDVYNKLIDVIHKHLDVLYKYYGLKKDVLNLDEIHLYDIYVSMVQELNNNYTFDEAKDIVINALSVLGEDYIKNLKRAFDERWIDKYNNKGKRGGAYSSGFYDTPPYVLLNFEGKYGDVTTLAHELGHSMHTHYSCTNQPYNLSNYHLFVAEVASTVNELLLVHYMIEHSKTKEEKLFLINELMELYKATIYRQVMFAEFERDMHHALEEGKVLTNEYISDEYYKLVKKYFGDDVVCDEEIKNEWMRIPHFYYDFYVYKYAIGLSCATKIANGILSGKEGALENYLAFLKTGGSMYPAEELKIAGVDIFDEKVYEEAIETFSGYINEFEKTYKK